MSKSDRLLGIPALLICVFMLSACGSDGNDDVTVSAIESVNFSAVAGHETGLTRLAKIDGRIQIGFRRDVWVDFSNGVKRRGLLHNCKGVDRLRDCEVWGTTTYKDAGRYTFSVTYNPSGIFSDPVTVTGTANVVAPGDFVVVSIGDSVASGEGNPVHPLAFLANEPAQWNDDESNYYTGRPKLDGSDKDCHRSITAGPVLAANRIARNNNITFIHIACSGAELGRSQSQIDPKNPDDRTEQDKQDKQDEQDITLAKIKDINRQLQWIRDPERGFPRIDVLLLSGGANDTSWVSAFETCLTSISIGSPCSENEKLKTDNDALIAKLPGFYSDLDNLIRCGDKESTSCTYDPDPTLSSGVVPAEDQVPTVVAITEYFDPTHDRFGTFPSLTTTGTKHCPTSAHALLNKKEWEFLHNNFLVPLNEAVQAAAGLHSWTHVGGIAAAFLKHGYCAGTILGEGSPSWVVAAGESEVNQGDINGIFHPNAPGHELYGERIYTEVVEANPPRTTASASNEGQPYTFGSCVWTDVEVTLAAHNPIEESGVDATYYAVGKPQCNALSLASGACTPYVGPFVIKKWGRSTVSFFSVNGFGAAETRSKPVEVCIE